MLLLGMGRTSTRLRVWSMLQNLETLAMLDTSVCTAGHAGLLGLLPDADPGQVYFLVPFHLTGYPGVGNFHPLFKLTMDYLVIKIYKAEQRLIERFSPSFKD